MAEIFCLSDAEEPRDLIHRAVHRLADGELVGVPTDCGRAIVAHSLQTRAVQKLLELSTAENTARAGKMTLAVKGRDEAYDYITPPGRVATSLMKRGWPGALTLALPVAPDKGLLRQLPMASRKSLQRMSGDAAWELWIRAPKHDGVRSILSLLPAPLVLWEHESIRSPPVFPEPLTRHVDLILEEQLDENLGPPTVVRVKSDSWTVLETGIVSDQQITRMTGRVIVFVCTGNTCRSPLAEALFRKMLAERLGCEPAELPERGYTIVSAGLAAAFGAPAAAESVAVAETRGAELRGHSSQPVTEELLAEADHIYTMTHGHRDAILSARPDLGSRISLLSVDDADISDPIGGGPREYEACGEEIARSLESLVEHWEPRPSREDT